MERSYTTYVKNDSLTIACPSIEYEQFLGRVAGLIFLDKRGTGPMSFSDFNRV